jgi:hypothetical protein
MKLLRTQTDEASLAAFGKEASSMLMHHNYSGLADRFGYALAYGRVPAAAIEADFVSAVASPLKAASGDDPSIAVKYFAPNDTGLFAVVECTVPVANGAAVLLELIVTGKEEERHITVEGISGVAA